MMHAVVHHWPRTLSCLLLLSLHSLAFSAPGDILWKALAGGVIFSGPAIDASGGVIVGSQDSNVYRYRPDGTLNWVFTGAKDWIAAAPTVGADGTIYAPSWDNVLYALDGETGTLEWSYETGGYLDTSVATGPDGTLYLASTDTLLYALNPDGTEKWIATDVENFSSITGSPVLSRDGTTVYFGNEEGTFFAVDAATGAPLWSFDIRTVHPPESESSPLSITAPAAVGNDGSLFFTSENNVLYALTQEGTFRWSYKAAAKIRSAPVLANGETIHFAAQDGYLYTLDTTGYQLWETFVGDVFYCTPALDAEGNIILGAYAGSEAIGAASSFVSVSSEGDILWQTVIAGYQDASPNIAPDGSIYLGAHDGYLYKLEGSAPPMNGEWPRYQGNPAQTGYLPGPGQEPSEHPIATIFPAVTEVNGDWARVPWFGRGWMVADDLPWVLHLDHGLIFIAHATSSSVWFYDPALQAWLYTGSGLVGYYYVSRTNNWVYFLATTEWSTGRWFYDYASGNWLSESQFATVPILGQ